MIFDWQLQELGEAAHLPHHEQLHYTHHPIAGKSTTELARAPDHLTVW